MKAIPIFAAVMLTSCGLFSADDASKVKELHRELCEALVVEWADDAGISVPEAIELGWDTLCMLNVGEAVEEAAAAARE